jgi:hypothetical protein
MVVGENDEAGCRERERRQETNPSDFAYAREGCFECPSVRRRNREFTSFKINLFELHVDP